MTYPTAISIFTPAIWWITAENRAGTRNYSTVCVLKGTNSLSILGVPYVPKKVISVAHTPTVMGIPVACIGDMVSCPQCEGTYPIVEGDSEFKIMGIPVALDGHKTECGATLISSVE